MKKLALVVPTLLLLAGCPRRPLDFGVYGRIQKPQVIIDAVKERRNAIKSVQGEAKAYLTTPDGSGKLSQYLVAEVPDHLRIESLSFFGDPIAVLTSNGQQFALHEIKQNHFYVGAATPENVSRLLPIQLPGDEIVSLVLGMPPLLQDARVVGFELNAREGIYQLTLTHGDAVEVLAVETSRLQPVRVDMGERPGLSPYRAEFEDYDEKPELPKDVRLFGPDGKTKVELKWKNREVNGEVDEEVFTQEAPENVPKTMLQ